MAAFARFSSSGASNDQAFQHDATPQSPKYITNATLRPSGEVTDRLGAPVRAGCQSPMRCFSWQ